MVHLIDNRERGYYSQKSDVESQESSAEKNILWLFLDAPSYRVVPIIKLKACEERNSTYVQALLLESKFGGCRITRNL